jgi:hypothetical protein
MTFSYMYMMDFNPIFHFNDCVTLSMTILVQLCVLDLGTCNISRISFIIFILIT